MTTSVDKRTQHEGELYSRPLLVQIQQRKHQSNVWNLFKVNIKDTKTTSIRQFECTIITFPTANIPTSGLEGGLGKVGLNCLWRVSKIFQRQN